jgi:hypothetical protein
MSEQVIQANTNEYRLYYLTKNPFPSAGVPEDEPPYCISREREVEAILRCLKSSCSSSTHISIVAGYGNGKTHLLKYIKKETVKQAGKSASGKVLVGYIACSGSSFRDIYRSFMYDLGYDFFYDLAWQLLGYTALKLIEKKDEGFTEESKKVLDCLKRDLLNVRELVDDGTIVLSTVVKEAKEEFLPIIKWQDFLVAFLQLTMEETGLLAWRWLNGDPTFSEQRRELGIVAPMDSDDRALQMFISIRKLLKILGYPLVCLLLDEFESIEMLIPQKKQLLLNSIRHLIDLSPTGLSLIIACTPETWTDVIREYHAFSERIFKEMPLRPLTDQNIGQFIKAYLQNSRETNGGSLERMLREKKMSVVDPELYPFTSEALKLILQTSQGNIRRTLSLCSMIIDASCFSRISLIDKVTLERLIDEF